MNNIFIDLYILSNNWSMHLVVVLGKSNFPLWFSITFEGSKKVKWILREIRVRMRVKKNGGEWGCIWGFWELFIASQIPSNGTYPMALLWLLLVQGLYWACTTWYRSCPDGTKLVLVGTIHTIPVTTGIPCFVCLFPAGAANELRAGFNLFGIFASMAVLGFQEDKPWACQKRPD